MKEWNTDGISSSRMKEMRFLQQGEVYFIAAALVRVSSRLEI